jgi:hypothetical protein
MTRYKVFTLPGFYPARILTLTQATILLIVPYSTKEDEVHVSTFPAQGLASFDTY